MKKWECRGARQCPLPINFNTSNFISICWKGAQPCAPTFFLLFLSARLLFASGEPDAFALTGVSARVGGMGNAAIGLADDIESIYYNPAGLGNLVQSGAMATYQAPEVQTSRSFLAANWRWKNQKLPGSLGFGWLRLRSTDIELTSKDEQVLGTDTLTNDLFLWGAGVHPWANVSLGASMKYFHTAFNGFSESGLGLDVGAHAQFSPFRVGVSLTDIGGTMLQGNSVANGATVKDKVPMRLRPGVGAIIAQPFNLPITTLFDVDALMKLQDAQDARLFLGTEIWGFQDRVAFRTGFQQGNGPTFGFGARWLGLQIDYAFLYSLQLKDEHRIETATGSEILKRDLNHEKKDQGCIQSAQR